MSETTPTPSRTTLPPRRPRRGWRAWLLALLIFAGGAASGAGVTAVVAVKRVQHAIRHPEETPARITAHLRRRLDLSDDQAAAIRQIVERRHRTMQAIRQDVWPQVRSELEGVRTDVAGVLDEPQRAKWEAMYQTMLERWVPPPPAPGER